VISLDTSVLLSHLLGETRRPPPELWSEMLVSSTLLEYEPWNRIHAYGLFRSHGEETPAVLASVHLIEMTSIALERAVDPFPSHVRTLDALHLATLGHLKDRGERPQLFAWDVRMQDGARGLGLETCEWSG
jgi:hypothetical protein